MFGVAWQTLVCKYFYDFITWYIEAHIIPYGVHKQRLFNILKMFSNKHWLVSWWNFHLVSENVNQIFGLYMITTRKWPDPSSFAGPHPSLWFRLKLYVSNQRRGLCTRLVRYGTVYFWRHEAMLMLPSSYAGYTTYTRSITVSDTHSMHCHTSLDLDQYDCMWLLVSGGCCWETDWGLHSNIMQEKSILFWLCTFTDLVIYCSSAAW